MATRFLTEAELRTKFGEAQINLLADRNGDGTVDSGVVEEKILDAESLALSRLYGRFTEDQIPADTDETSAWLKGLVGYVALYYLQDHFAQRSQKVIDDYKEALLNLDKIQAGQLSAVLSDQPAVDSGRAFVSSVSRSATLDEPRITLSNMRDWGHRS